MTSPPTLPSPSLESLETAWERSDRIFALLEPEAILARPIPLRQPFLFYVGHLPAFAWNHLWRRVAGKPPFAADLDDLFERGIDPPDDGDAPVDESAAWPSARRGAWPIVTGFEPRCRTSSTTPGAREVAPMVLEHELMHHETLLYMVQQLPADLKRGLDVLPALPAEEAPQQASVRVPAGPCVLGALPGTAASGGTTSARSSRSRCRLPDRRAPGDEPGVPGVRGERRLRRSAAVDPRRLGLDRAPRSSPARLVELEPGGDPGSGSLRRSAFRRGRRLAGLGHALRGGGLRPMAGGATADRARVPPRRLRNPRRRDDESTPGATIPRGPEHGNFGFQLWSPAPVGSHPAGASAFGVHELVGNGWEWTSTPFGPFPGFEPSRATRVTPPTSSTTSTSSCWGPPGPPTPPSSAAASGTGSGLTTRTCSRSSGACGRGSAGARGN